MPGNESIESVRDRILEEAVVLCVRLGADVPLVEACRAALKGGLRVLELTLTTPGALEAMETLSREGSALVGGGTVLSPMDVHAVAEAGARFVFSPVFDPEVVDEAHRLGLLAVPGAGSATEILAAHRHGARLVKLFPAGALGGPGFLRALRGPLPDLPVIATSGPTAATIAEYLSAGASAVGIGSEVFPTGGFSLPEVEAAARRVRQAAAAARSGAPAPAMAEVDVTTLRVGMQAARGVACTGGNPGCRGKR